MGEEPARPQNAYWIWLSDNRQALIKEIGSGNVGAVGKLGGERWKAMTGAQKAPYEKKAAEGKANYEKAMEAFKAQGGVPGKRRQEKKEAKDAKAAKKELKEARKNSDRPKRPQNAYWIWLSDNRQALVKEIGNANVGAVGKLGGERWKALSSAARAPFEKKAAALKAEYDKAIAEWKEKNGGAAEEGDEEEDDADKEN